jgi:predicted ABC-type ATPase
MAPPTPNPTLYVIAGPNGAGKTTFANRYLPLIAHCQQFVNADLIAKGLAPFAPETAALRAGRLMLEEIQRLASQRVDFAIETTLSGKLYAPWFRKLRQEGYQIYLFFLWLPTVDMALERVAGRVRHGGHFVPEEDVRRRYERGIRNLFDLYRPLVDWWGLFDNTEGILRRIAYEHRGKLYVMDAEVYARLSRKGPADD